MTIINLRDFYPEIYAHDQFTELPDEVAATLVEYKLKDAAYRLRTYRHRAYYSLDYGDGIEKQAVVLVPSPFEIIEQRRLTELIYKGISRLPDKQARRIHAHYFLGMSKAAIARAEGRDITSVKESIERGLRSLQKFLEENL